MGLTVLTRKISSTIVYARDRSAKYPQVFSSLDRQGGLSMDECSSFLTLRSSVGRRCVTVPDHCLCFENLNQSNFFCNSLINEVSLEFLPEFVLPVRVKSSTEAEGRTGGSTIVTCFIVVVALNAWCCHVRVHGRVHCSEILQISQLEKNPNDFILPWTGFRFTSWCSGVLIWCVVRSKDSISLGSSKRRE